MRLFIHIVFAWIGSQIDGVEGLFIGCMGNIMGGISGYCFALRVRAKADAGCE